MALRARLSAPRPERADWSWHTAKWTALPASILFSGDRRMEAETYVASGYGIRLALEARKTALTSMGQIAKVWQPSRLKGVQVSPEFGTPFLAATQVFDLRPVPRKWLALERTDNAAERFVMPGMILVTCSGSVGRATLAHKPHEKTLISHDLLRVKPLQNKHWGWIYAYLRSPQARAMMSAAQYGHIIKHLEVSHLNALPVPMVRDALLAEFNEKTQAIVDKRNRAHELSEEAEARFAQAIGGAITPTQSLETGFTVQASSLFQQRRRLEASYHTPTATEILNLFNDLGLKVESLSTVTKKIWWMTRFKRVFGDEGVPYVSADELFTLNPSLTKRVLVEQADNAAGYFVKAGWLIMACSGQVYGLNGSVALTTRKHENAFFSHDLVRIIPRRDLIRLGYLFVALSQPQLGRPLVIRYAYGTSIPHLEPSDLSGLPVVRLGRQREKEIAALSERAILLHAQADMLENDLTTVAETLIDRLLAGDCQDFAHKSCYAVA